MKQTNRSREHHEHMHQNYDFALLHPTQKDEQRERQPVGHEDSSKVIPPEMPIQQIEARSPHGDGVTIVIDHMPYTAASGYITAAQLRSLSSPPIGEDRDIFRVSSSGSDDIRIGDADVVEIHLGAVEHGRHFYSARKAQGEPVEELAKRAYFIYLDQGCQHGHDVGHWLAAEKQMASRT